MLFPLKKLVTLSVALTLVAAGQSQLQAKEIKNSRGEVIVLNPTAKPSENFDLTDWSISLPIDTNKDGVADNVPENYLSKGLEVSPLFYTAEDGGMVFTAPVEGPKTSKNTTYTRSELREMLRAGDTSIKVTGITENNWVFSSAKRRHRNSAGAVDGILEATLAVNHVTTTISRIPSHYFRVGIILIVDKTIKVIHGC